MADTRHITAAMCAGGRSLGDPRLSPDGATVAYGTTAGGRPVLAAVDAAGGPELILTTRPSPARSAADGRGVFDWLPDGRGLVHVTGDGGLAVQPIDGGPGRDLPGLGAGPVAGPVVSPDGRRVAYTVDGRHVAVAHLDLAGPWPVRASAAPDFCVDPAWSADGASVVWHEWDVPAMPWDDSRVAMAPAGGGAVTHPDLPVGDAWGVAVGQPRPSPDGSRLGFLCDANGWLVPWIAERDGLRPLVPGGHEYAGPTWGCGQRTWTWSPDGRAVALARNEGGFGRLLLVEVDTGRAVTLGRGVFNGLSWQAGRLAAIRSGAVTPDQLVVYDLPDDPFVDGGSAADPPRLEVPRRTLARGPVAGFGPALVEPESVRWEGEARPRVGAAVFGRLTRSPAVPEADEPPPSSPAATDEPPPSSLAATDEPPPLLVRVHGGPTGQTRVAFDARTAFFADRGWNILTVDPRGSTGWGRAYTQALREEWGRLDVDDVAAGIRAAHREGWGDPARTAIMGGSSGGLVVLNVLATHPDLCAAGVDLYGVTDLLDLDDTTHRYEAHYNLSLVGPRPAALARYRERSPLHLAAGITAPLLVLHGDADVNVVPRQSEALVESLRWRGATVEYHRYEGEGHGWSRPETVSDELERIDSFLTRHVLHLPRRP